MVKTRRRDYDLYENDPAAGDNNSVARFKDDLDHFNVPVDSNKDFISHMPAERALKKSTEGSDYVERPHVLLSMAAMSKRFYALVERFSVHHLTKYKRAYRFRTTAERDAARRSKAMRRSARLSAKPVHDSRVYRMELVHKLQVLCIHCHRRATDEANMCHYVGICAKHLRKELTATINLTEALKEYDLRDYMLIASRKPGPRAKYTNRPTIPYYTRKSGTPILLGRCISYRFFKRDVKRIACLVHGNVKTHMSRLRKERVEREQNRKCHTRRALKMRYHAESSAQATTREEKQYHQQRHAFYSDLDPDYGYESDGSGYGDYDDVHKRLCSQSRCRECRIAKMTPLYEKYGRVDLLVRLEDDYSDEDY